MRNIFAQVSVEYLIVIGFATMMTIPLLLIYYTYTSDTNDSIATTQALQIARKIVDASESVYYMGKPSQTTLKVSFPDQIYSINLSNYEVVFKMKTKTGVADIVQVSSANMSGSLPTSRGLHLLTLVAQDNYVQISSN